MGELGIRCNVPCDPKLSHGVSPSGETKSLWSGKILCVVLLEVFFKNITETGIQ